MKSAITPLLIVILLSASQAGAAPAPPGPSAAAVRQVEARREALRPLETLDPERLPAEQRAEALNKMEPALKDLETALAARDAYVFGEAVRDVTNGCYRGFPRDRVLGLLLPRIKTPETDRERMVYQGYVMEHLGRRYGAEARAALPDLLAMVTDDKVVTYLRGQAIDAAARIAPRDEAVVKAFIRALTNPNPKSESGIHDRAAGWLGEMGKAAASAKPALLKLFDRGPWYEDAAFVALGKIGRDEGAGTFDDSLDLLAKPNKVSVEQAAAAFENVVAAGKEGKAARPVLLTVVEGRPDDVYSRAALRALRDVGPGSGARAAKALARALLRDHSSVAVEALGRLEPTDPEAVAPLAEAFAEAAGGDDWYTPAVIADSLARYGKAARTAAPAVIKALRRFHTRARSGVVYGEQFAAYLGVLAAVGGDEPDVRRVVIDLLDPAGDLLKKPGPGASEYQFHLLLTLARLGLPPSGEDRKAALPRVRDGLSSESGTVFCAAARVVIAARPLAAEEAGPLVPPLSRVLAPDFRFKEPQTQVVGRPREPLTAEESALAGPGLAVRALGSLGPAAREALPAVRAVADRPLEVRKSDFLPDPPGNALIREARKSVEAIR
jgi:hypothetical protein